MTKRREVKEELEGFVLEPSSARRNELFPRVVPIEKGDAPLLVHVAMPT